MIDLSKDDSIFKKIAGAILGNGSLSPKPHSKHVTIKKVPATDRTPEANERCSESVVVPDTSSAESLPSTDLQTVHDDSNTIMEQSDSSGRVSEPVECSSKSETNQLSDDSNAGDFQKSDGSRSAVDPKIDHPQTESTDNETDTTQSANAKANHVLTAAETERRAKERAALYEKQKAERAAKRELKRKRQQQQLANVETDNSIECEKQLDEESVGSDALNSLLWDQLSEISVETEQQTIHPCNTYIDYCLAIKEGDKSALLVHYIRTWFITLLRYADKMEESLTLDQYVAPQIQRLSDDALSYILLRCNEAFSHIVSNMRDKIIRENTMMPVQKAREIDSAGMNWLCRRPGTTIREKLAGTHSLLAVKRRMSLDTGENRLLLSMSQMTEKLINAKIDNVTNDIGIDEETEFLRILKIFKQTEGIDEVHVWNNMPPNNVLLSDRYYRQIWNAWNELNSLDSLICDDFQNLSLHLSVILYANIIDILKKSFRFIQQPIDTEYTSCYFAITNRVLNGISLDGKAIEIMRDNSVITIKYQKYVVQAEIHEAWVIMQANSIRSREADISNDHDERKPRHRGRRRRQAILGVTFDTIRDVAETVISALAIPATNAILSYHPSKEYHEMVAIDIFQVRPTVSLGKNPPSALSFRLLGQNQSTGDQSDTYISCANSQALAITESQPLFSLISAIRSGNQSQISILTHQLHKYVDCRTLSYIFPDCYNEFELSALRTALRLTFRNIEALPQSIATVFHCGDRLEWKNSFKSGDFALAIDLSGTCCMLTLLKGVWANPEEFDNYNGLTWERYPTYTFDLEGDKKSALAHTIERFCALSKWKNLPITEYKLLQKLGIEGVLEVIRTSAILLEDNSWVCMNNAEVDDIQNMIKLNVSEAICDFLSKMVAQIKGHNVHTILLSPYITCDSVYSPVLIERSAVLGGLECYQKAVKNNPRQTLWRDHLPKLSIKRFVGKFDLVQEDNAPICPIFNKRVPIRIDRTFTLPKGQEVYRFQLIQGDNGIGARYAAVVEHKAFPLKESVECMLRMSYCYGSDNPYSLTFVPLDPTKTGFSEVKVKWIPLERFPSDELPTPPFPHSLTWGEAKKYPNKKHPEKGDTDLLDWLTNGLDKMVSEFELPRATYTLINPIRPNDWRKATQGHFRIAIATAKVGNDIIRLKLMDSLFDDVEETKREIRVISCSLKEMQEEQEYETLELSKYNVTWKANAYGHFCTIKRIHSNEKQIIVFYESNFEPGTFSESVDLVSFSLVSKPQSIKVESISLSEYSLDWQYDRNGFGYCFENIQLSDGSEQRIFFHEKSFMFSSDYPPPYHGTLSFTIQEKTDGSIQARNIVVGNICNYQAVSIFPGHVKGTFYTRNLRSGNNPSFDPLIHCKKTLFFPLHTVFSGGKSLGDIECTDELRYAIKNAVPYIIKAYNNRDKAYNPEEVSWVSLTILSRLANNIGEEYYKLASQALDDYLTGGSFVPTIGYGLEGLETKNQQELWAKVLTLPEIGDIIEICAYAAWNNQRFIFAVDRTRVLSLFESTVTLLEALSASKNKKMEWTNQLTLARYIEFLLAVFRLRELNDAEINNYLSLNNPIVEKLYQIIEKLYDQQTPIKSFLSFEVGDDIPYEKMPAILYTLIVCITGENGGSEIIISALNDEDIDF